MNSNTLSLFKWRAQSSLGQKIILAVLMAALTGLCAQIKVPLPFSPVPITGQTFAVLLAGIFLGRHWGGISQILYIGLGAAGIPWFSGMSFGPAILMGPTGGYLVGFVLAACFVGYISDRYVKSRQFFSMLSLMIFATFGLIFLPGLIHLALWSHVIQGEAVSLSALFTMGLTPFIPGAFIKSFLAASVATAILPKSKFS